MGGGAEVATPQAVREVRADGRGALGRDRVVLPGGEQGPLGLRRRDQQQDPRHPTTGVRTSGRGVPPPQNPHVHAAANLKVGPKLPTRLGEEPEIYGAVLSDVDHGGIARGSLSLMFRQVGGFVRPMSRLIDDVEEGPKERIEWHLNREAHTTEKLT